jgi:hypothetical protein
MIVGKTKRPRNVDATRVAAILYRDWGTSKAYAGFCDPEAKDTGRPLYLLFVREQPVIAPRSISWFTPENPTSRGTPEIFGQSQLMITIQ